MGTNLRILVLEDDPNMLQILEEVLEEEGYSVDACSQGDEAVSLARENVYDLVVADIKMDGLDGLGAMSEVQSYQPDVGSLVITGYADQIETERAARLHLNGLLKKPFELDQFLDSVSQILATRAHQLTERRKIEGGLQRARWATDWTAQLLQSIQEYPFSQLSRLTRKLSEGMGLEGPRAEQLCLAALQKAAEAKECPIPSNLPSEMGRFLEAADERWDGKGPLGLAGRSIPVEARILALALVAVENGESESDWAKRFDPVALQTLENLHLQPDQNTEDAEPETGDKGLLHVARTLLEVGDYTNAQRALQDLVNEDAASPSGVEATLELARVKGFLGQKKEAIRLASRAPELGSHFGPVLAAQTGYRSAILLCKFGSKPGAAGLLTESAAIYQDLGIGVRADLCELALNWVENNRFTEKDCARIELLLFPENRTVLLDCLEWLVPSLLRSPSAKVEQSLSKLVIQFPQAVASALTRASLEERQFALKVLQDLDSPVAAGVIAGLISENESELIEQVSKLPANPVEPTAEITLRTLGKFDFYSGDAALSESAWRTSKVKYLLARLAASEGTVSEDALLEDFWPGDLRRAKKNLQATTSYLRQSLRKAGVKGDFVQKVPGGLLLNPAFPFWHDLRELKTAAAQAKHCSKQNDRIGCLKNYRQLFEVFNGPFLEECYMEWAIQIRREVEDTVIEASLQLAEAALEKTKFDEALECARTALKLDPCLAEAIGYIMHAYIGLQRPSAAVRQFESYKRALALEFDAFPSIELERLHQQARLSF